MGLFSSPLWGGLGWGLFYLHRWYSIFLHFTLILLQYLYHLALPCAIRQLRTNRHVPELGVQHLFLRVRQPVLLFGRLITRQNIQKDQTHNQPNQRVLFSDLLAPQLIAVQPTLYVMYICHILIFSLPSSSRFHSPLLILSFLFAPPHLLVFIRSPPPLADNQFMPSRGRVLARGRQN